MPKNAPTYAQVRALTSVWLTGTTKIGGYDTPTMLVLVKRGWIAPNGETGLYPSGTEYRVHNITDAGLDAIEDYLRELRYKRKSAAA